MSPDPVVEAVVRFEDLRVGSSGSRRAVVRWSDGSEGEALGWYGDLSRYLDKSPYAERLVMPSPPRIARWWGWALKFRSA
jgi:hypothetical protein